MKQVNQKWTNKILRKLDCVLANAYRLVVRSSPSQTFEQIPLLVNSLGALKKLQSSKKLTAQTPTTARAAFVKLSRALKYDFPVAGVYDIAMNLGTHTVSARHYQPFTENQLPMVLVYFHGGGFVFGDLETHDDICRFLCGQTGAQVLSIDYRLAPEHPYPAGLNDARGALLWVQENAESQFGVSPKHIAVAGDSAGGNFAATLAQTFGQTIGQALLACLLCYPSTDKSRQWLSAQRYAQSAFLSCDDRDWFYQHYMSGHEIAQTSLHTDVSPLLGLGRNDFFEQKLGNQSTQHPPTVVVTGGRDILQDEGIAYANQLKELGGTVKHIELPHFDHAFLQFIGVNQATYCVAKSIALQFRQLCQQALAAT